MRKPKFQYLRKLFDQPYEPMAIFTLVIILGAAVFTWWIANLRIQRECEARLLTISKSIESAISTKITGHAYTLNDLKGFVELKGIPSTAEFEQWVDAANVIKRSPDLQAIAYASILQEPQISAVEQQMRAQGNEQFEIWPKDRPAPLTPVLLVQPEDWRNKSILGFNLSAEPRRTAAIQSAVRHNALAITDSLSLFEGGKSGEEQGFLIFLPVFFQPTAFKPMTDDYGSRQNQPQGLLTLMLRTQNFFEAVLGSPSFYGEKVNFVVETTDQSSGKKLPFYQRFPNPKQPPRDQTYSVSLDAKVYDKTWTFTFQPLPHFFTFYDRYIPWISAFSMLLALSLVFLMVTATLKYLRLEKQHVKTLSDRAVETEAEAKILRVLNQTIADLSDHSDLDSLYEHLCHYMHNVHHTEECIIYMRAGRSPSFIKTFGETHPEYPHDIVPNDELESLFTNRKHLLSSERDAEWIRSFFPEKFAAALVNPYWMIIPSYYTTTGQLKGLIVVTSKHRILGSELDQHCLRSVILHFDISLEKDRLIRNAEEANQTKSAFLANMSHEIRTPLGAIVGFSEMLANAEIPAAKKDFLVENVRRNSRQLIRLIDDILDISKVEAGKLELHLDHFLLDDIMEDVRATITQRHNLEKVKFEILKAPKLPDHVYTDDVRLKQILLNLLDNAFKFTDEGSVRLLYNAYTNAEGTPYLEFQVHDTGMGISEAQRAGLFQPFFQGDGTNTRKYRGTGLGLALSKKLAEMLSGELFLQETRENQGSVFTLRISLAEAAAKTSGNVPPKMVSQAPITYKRDELKNLCILLVEDSVDNIEIFSYFLTSAGADLKLAQNGRDAVEMAREDKPSLILMDIQLPLMDGKEATRAIRKQGFKGPIVALTAHAFPEEIDACLEAGCDGHITKPVSGDQLIQEVKFHLNLKSKRKKFG